MIITAIAIDDEPMALEVIKAHAGKVDFIDLKETFVSSKEALSFLKNETIDLVFLDINMPDITGLDVSQLLPENVKIVFTTAYSQYAADAFNLNALDYLVKPFDFARFLKACQKTKETLTKTFEEQKYLFVKDSYDLVRIEIDNLLYVKSDGNYLTFYEKGKQTMTRMTMTEAIKTLPEKTFMRVHKSHVINLNHVQKIERHQVQLDTDIFVPVAGNYHSELMEEIKRLWTVK